jgi:hypothetical protein
MEDMRQFQNMRNRFAQEGSDEVCLPVLDSICGLNIAWMLLVILFLWFSTMGGIAALMPAAPDTKTKEKKDAAKKKDDAKGEDDKDDKDEDDKDDKDDKDDQKQDKKKEGNAKSEKEQPKTSAAANSYLTMLTFVCVAMVLLGAYQILNPADPYANMGNLNMPGKFGQQRAYVEDDGSDGLVRPEDNNKAHTPTQGSCGGGAAGGGPANPLDAGGAAAPAEPCDGGDDSKLSKKKKNVEAGKKLAGGRRVEYTFDLDSYGDMAAMKAYADANDIVGSVRQSRGGGIEGRVQAAGDKLQAMRDWMEDKGTLGSWEEALKHPLKKFEIKTGSGH